MTGRRATLLAALTFAASGAAAHALLKSAAPAPGSTVRAAPEQVVIRFSEPLEPRFSSIEVRDASGHRVDRGGTHGAEDDPRRLAVALAPLVPGAYQVTWRATSVDTHRTEGSYRFTYGP